AGQVDVAHAAAAEQGFDLVRAGDQPDRHSLQELLRLESGELTLANQVVRNLSSIVADRIRHGAQGPLKLLAVEQTAAQCGSHKRIDLSRHAGSLWFLRVVRRSFVGAIVSAARSPWCF